MFIRNAYIGLQPQCLKLRIFANEVGGRGAPGAQRGRHGGAGKWGQRTGSVGMPQCQGMKLWIFRKLFFVSDIYSSTSKYNYIYMM